MELTLALWIICSSVVLLFIAAGLQRLAERVEALEKHERTEHLPIHGA